MKEPDTQLPRAHPAWTAGEAGRDDWRLEKRRDWQNEEQSTDGEIDVLETPPELADPPLYKVVMLNDDFTPMEFALLVLRNIFRLDDQRATEVMLTVHSRGSAVCGVYPRDIAETRMFSANEYSRRQQYPLRCTMEPKS